MKRSQIHQVLKAPEAMCTRCHCHLPSFRHFTPQQWQTTRQAYEKDKPPYRLLCSEYPEGSTIC